jgi:hypothetical protein
MTEADRTVTRLKAKLARRDRKIAGLQRKLEMTQRTLAMQSMLVQRLPIDVERAVQRALCNVRMIPVLGIAGSDRIVEVRAADKSQSPA